MKILTITLAFSLTSTLSYAGASLKLEGSCSGTTEDGSPIELRYYSDFDGCKTESSAAVSFSSGREGLNIGNRKFVKDRDVYSFESEEGKEKQELLQLSFANSTGNTSGMLQYADENGKPKKIPLQCEIRDYEYAECGGEI